MLTELFFALGVQAINSQTFKDGYYYEYSLDKNEAGAYRITRRLRNRYEVRNDEPSAVVETEAQAQECRQAIMYNFPHAFRVDGAIAIDLTQETEVREEQGVAGGADAEQETDSSTSESGTEVEPNQQPY